MDSEFAEDAVIDPYYCCGSEDDMHCLHWYDGEPCCDCGDLEPLTLAEEDFE